MADLASITLSDGSTLAATSITQAMIDPSVTAKEVERVLMSEAISPDKIVAIPTPEKEPSAAVRSNLSHRGGGAKAAKVITPAMDGDEETRAGVIQNCDPSIITQVDATETYLNQLFQARRILRGRVAGLLDSAKFPFPQVRWEIAAKWIANLRDQLQAGTLKEFTMPAEAVEPDPVVRALLYQFWLEVWKTKQVKPAPGEIGIIR